MKKWTKIMALVLALSMLMSVMAFADTDDIMTPYGKYPETVTMTTVKKSDTNPTWTPGDSLDNNLVTRYVLDKVNVQTVTNWETEASAYIEKLSLDIVAGTLPDMWTLDNDDYLVYKMLYENGQLADLTEAYDLCANDYLRDTAESFNYVHFEPYTEDGKLMGIPTGRYGYEQNLLWIRGDILEETGMTIDDIKTLDDIEAFLTKVTEVEPDIIPLALNATDPLNADYGLSYSADQVAEVFGCTPRYWLKQDDGSITYGSLNPGMKDAMGLLADWYQKGLIDKEFATRTGSGQTDAIVQGGEVAAFWAPWWYGWTADDLILAVSVDENGDYLDAPLYEWEITNAPLNDEGKYVTTWPKVAGTTLFVNANCETPEAAIKVFNTEYDIFRGFDHDAWVELDHDGREEYGGYRSTGWGYLLPTGWVNMEYADVVPRYGHGLVRFYETNGEDTTGFKLPSELNGAITSLEKRADDWTYDYGTYICRCIASPITDAPEVEFVYPAFSGVTENMADLWPSLLTLEQQYVLQVIIGQKSVDDFDAFCEQWLAEGGQILLDEITAMIN